MYRQGFSRHPFLDTLPLCKEADDEHDQNTHAHHDEIQGRGTQLQEAAVRQGIPVAGGKHGTHHLEGKRHIPVHIQYPDQAHEPEGPEDLNTVPELRIGEAESIMKSPVQRCQLLRYQQHQTVDHSPDDEVPGRTVPDTGGKPDNNGGDINRNTLTKRCPQLISGPL